MEAIQTLRDIILAHVGYVSDFIDLRRFHSLFSGNNLRLCSCMYVCVHVCVYVCAGVCVPSVRGRFADRACTWVVVMRVAASLCRCVYNGPGSEWEAGGCEGPGILNV